MIVINNLIMAQRKHTKELFMYCACQLEGNSSGVVSLITGNKVDCPCCYVMKKKILGSLEVVSDVCLFVPFALDECRRTVAIF